MQTILAKLRAPALLGFLLVLPFLILEIVNRRNFHEGLPVLLFGVMWLLPVVFLLILMPIVRNVRRAGNSLLQNPVRLLLRVASLVLIAIVWMVILLDQWPCFLGMPLCD